jgi:hypothetical protein
MHEILSRVLFDFWYLCLYITKGKALKDYASMYLDSATKVLGISIFGHKGLDNFEYDFMMYCYPYLGVRV